MSESARVAVLIDADNISPALASAIMTETAKHGILSIKRIYGDWTTNQLAGWKKVFPSHAIQPQQQFAYRTGKNATDSALIIDAMDLLYAGNVDAFCIVANDSDYTRLAVRLRESGRRVFGLGRKEASTSFQNACDRFTFLEVLADVDAAFDDRSSEDRIHPESADPFSAGLTANEDQAGTTKTSKRNAHAESIEDAARIILPAVAASAAEDGWALLANVGWAIVNNNPTFDSRNYGYEKLGALVRAIDTIETKIRPDANGFGQLWARVRDPDAPLAATSAVAPIRAPE